MKTSNLRTWIAGACVFGVALVSGSLPLLAQSTPPASKADASAKPRRVIVIFKNGNQLEGELLSESDASIRLRVVVAGIKAETDYNRSEIKEIKDVKTAEEPKPAAPTTAPESDAAPAPAPDAPAVPAVDPSAPPVAGDLSGLEDEAAINFGDQSWRVTTRAAPSEPNGRKVYILNMNGEFGRDVSYTPMKEVLRDMKKYQPDVVVCFFNHTFGRFGQNREDVEVDLGSFDQLGQASQIAALLIDEIRDDPGFKTKPRMVAWIRKAMGGAAFLPFIFKEVYFTPDGLHGGIGELEHIFDGRGDERAREKQYSLRQARGEGLAIMGGHDPLIMRAMARTDFILSYKVENGQVVFLPGKTNEAADEILLTDDGKDSRADSVGDWLRGLGNDTLTLKPDVAFRLGFSKGTAERLDDLMYQLGEARNYVVVRGRGNAILREWSKQVGDAETQFSTLFRKFGDVRVKAPGDYAARTRARGEQKQILLKIKALLEKYKEAINPRRIRGAPEQWTTEIDSIIQRIEAQQLADRPERR